MPPPSTTNANPPGPPVSNTTSAPHPPDEAVARKARINADLISAFKRPCPPGAASSIKGIGLYTHIEGVATLSPNGQHSKNQPEFLPINPSRGEIEEHVSEDLRPLWERLRDAVQEEEQLVGKIEFSMAFLKKRYDGFDAPDFSLAHQAALREQDTAMQQDIAGQDGGSVDARRQSLKSGLANLAVRHGDAPMGGTEPERGRKSTRHAEFYGEDPRMRRR